MSRLSQDQKTKLNNFLRSLNQRITNFVEEMVVEAGGEQGNSKASLQTPINEFDQLLDELKQPIQSGPAVPNKSKTAADSSPKINSKNNATSDRNQYRGPKSEKNKQPPVKASTPAPQAESNQPQQSSPQSPSKPEVSIPVDNQQPAISQENVGPVLNQASTSSVPPQPPVEMNQPVSALTEQPPTTPPATTILPETAPLTLSSTQPDSTPSTSIPQPQPPEVDSAVAAYQPPASQFPSEPAVDSTPNPPQTAPGVSPSATQSAPSISTPASANASSGLNMANSLLDRLSSGR